MIKSRLLLLLQLLVTVAIICLVTSPIIQLGLLLSVWLVTFWPLTADEIVLFIVSCGILTIIDIIVTSRGVFQFTQKDLWGLPIYEPLIWGYFFLHAKRMLSIASSKKFSAGLFFGVLMMLTLTFSLQENILYLASLLVFILAFNYFKTIHDLKFVAYLIFIGLIVEITGTSFGIWTYHIHNYVLWWIITWGFSGLLLYRLFLPLAQSIVSNKKS